MSDKSTVEIQAFNLVRDVINGMDQVRDAHNQADVAERVIAYLETVPCVSITAAKLIAAEVHEYFIRQEFAREIDPHHDHSKICWSN